VGHPAARPRARTAGDGRGAAAPRRARVEGRLILLSPRRPILLTLGLAGILVCEIAGCARPLPVPPGVADVTGTWEGVWTGGVMGGGRIAMTLTQSDTLVTGTLSMTGLPAISATDGKLEGRVGGNTFRFRQPDGVIDAAMTVAGDEMDGVATGTLRLTLSLRRQPPPN